MDKRKKEIRIEVKKERLKRIKYNKQNMMDK